MTEETNQEGQSGRIKSLESSLYSRKKEQIAKRKRRDLHERDYGVEDAWKEVEEEVSMKSRRPAINVVLIASLAFFVISAAFSTFLFFKGVTISPNNIIISVEGPALVGGGEELGLQITVKNNNPVAVEVADLIIEYPNGTRRVENVDIELLRHRESLGTIDPGKEVRVSVSSILFGEEDSNKTVEIFVEYRVEGSNAIFTAESTYDIVLSSSPLSLTIEGLEEAISGQEVSFTAIIKSNSSNIIKNAMLQVEYPFGFEFTESSPKAVFANRTWYLGDIPPEEEVEVTFTGTLTGQDGEERVFRFATGLQSETDENNIGAEFINILESLVIKRPFITADLVINGSKDDFVSKSGKVVRGDITWVNNLPTQIFDGEIDVKISGDIVDRSTVSAEQGFFRSVDNRLIWTQLTNNSLSSIAAGDTGNVGFTFSTYGVDSGKLFRNPTIDLDVTVRGKRISGGSVPEEIISTVSKQIRIESNLVVTSKVLHNTGTFTNSGPVPPQADKETTYTVVLSVLNTSNEVSNGTVSMTLPPYVQWLGIISPRSEEITFSPVGGQIIWNLGDISAGTGTTLPLRELSFQVKLVPSITHIGSAPTLVNTQTISGFDTFTRTDVGGTRSALTTRINESGQSDNSGRVVK